jgi:hypothetical protein
MTIIVDLKGIDVVKLFHEALTSSYSNNIIKELRRVLRKELEVRLATNGIKVVHGKNEFTTQKLVTTKFKEWNPIHTSHGEDLNLKFCEKYGTSDSSHTALNYHYGFYTELPLLQTFRECNSFSIGNLILYTENIDAEVILLQSNDLKAVGYSYDISRRKKRSFICIFGIHFSSTALEEVFKQYNDRDAKSALLEVRIARYKDFPVLFASKYQAKLYTCTCFKGYVDSREDILRYLGGIEYYPKILERINQIEYVDGICHLCTKTVPDFEYGSPMYYNSFLQRYLPYQILEYKKLLGKPYSADKVLNEEIENKLRLKIGYPKIGEQWISETTLYKIVQEIFPQYQVQFHYRGKELGGQEIDIWIPELFLGFEYQGVQHYEEVKHWGGREGLEKRKIYDQRKRQICKVLNYRIVEFHYNDPLNRDTVINKLANVNLPFENKLEL